MRPTTSNIFHTSLAFHPSSLAARSSTRVGNRSVGSHVVQYHWLLLWNRRHGSLLVGRGRS